MAGGVARYLARAAATLAYGVAAMVAVSIGGVGVSGGGVIRVSVIWRLNAGSRNALSIRSRRMA